MATLTSFTGRGGEIISNPLQPSRDITALLIEWREGDATAVDRLMPLVYDELHRVAARAMRNESSGHTLQTTALVHEAYLRMVDQKGADWQNRAQFFGIAAKVMRRVLVDHARERLADKRGGGARRVSLENVHGKPEEAVDILSLDGALERLHDIDPLQSRVVELRYFTGLNIEETADALDISASTVKREWAIARAWLKRELS